MTKLLHRLKHRLGWHRGTVVSALDDRGTVWIGFKCATCGKISGVAPSSYNRPPNAAFK